MDVSEDSDCTIEEVTPTRTKKMKQAQLPFQMLSSSKSPSSTDNVRNKKKRKIMSSSIESKSPKIVKLATKENSVRSIIEKEEENANEKKNE